ncbi:MAG: lactate utilization protein [Smithellaceae bacterium]|nr:lactate utilization protein [Smithellaceae bacterium]
MPDDVRRFILRKLKNAPAGTAPSRPPLPPLPVLSLNREKLISLFTENLAEQTGMVYRAANAQDIKPHLAEIAAREQVKIMLAATDAVLAPLHLRAWGKTTGVEVLTAEDFPDRESYREAAFNRVQAGVTGADWGVAESGTICLLHDRDQPRLISIAPLLHIAVLPVERLVAVYEQVVQSVYADKNRLPAHFTFITGPSMTADIQGGPFKGMHGPRKLIVILVG